VPKGAYDRCLDVLWQGEKSLLAVALMQANGHHLRLSEGVQNKQTAVRKTERAGTVSPSQEKARGRGQPVKVCKCLKRGCKEDRARLLSVVPSDSTRAMCPN